MESIKREPSIEPKSMVERINDFWDVLSRIKHLGSARLPEKWTGRLSPALIYYEALVSIIWHLQGDPQLFKFLSDNCRGSGLDSIAKNKKFSEFVQCWGNELPNQKRPRFNDDILKEMRDTLHSFSQKLFIVFESMYNGKNLKENLLEAALEYDKGERGAGAHPEPVKAKESTYSLLMTTKELFNYITIWMIEEGVKADKIPKKRTFETKLTNVMKDEQNIKQKIIVKQLEKYKVKTGTRERVISWFKRAK